MSTTIFGRPTRLTSQLGRDEFPTTLIPFSASVIPYQHGYQSTEWQREEKSSVKYKHFQQL
jgi:hypothetical protein